MHKGYFDTNFGLSDELLREVMGEAMSRGGDWADIYAQHQQSTYVGFEDDIVNQANTSIDLGVGIRVISGDQTGYAFSEDLSPASLKAAARTAASIANAGAKTAPANLTRQSLKGYYDTDYDWQNVELEGITTLLNQINAKTKGADASVARVTAWLQSSQSRILVVDSDGRVSFDNQPLTRLYLTTVMEKNGVTQSNAYNVSARDGMGFYSEARVSRVIDEALARTRILFEAKEAPAGELPVVLAAGSSGILLHEAIGHGMEADFNRKGISIFADRIGKKVADEHVTIVDSGIDPRLRGAINVDDEGSLPQSTKLVENGIMKSYLHDRISAKHYGVEPTGSGRRESFRHPVQPRMRATYMLPGPHAKDEIIGSVKKGIYCISFTNGQVDIGGGDYSFYVKNGYLIEDGKLTAPIKDVNIIGNGPESLARITMVGDDFAMDEGGWTCGKGGQSVPVSLGLPTVLVSGITVGGAA